MAAIRFLLVFFCFTVNFGSIKPGRHLLNRPSLFDTLALRERLLTIARKEIGVRELRGRNDGPQVEAYLSSSGLKKGAPWCASFISWTFQQAGYPEPRTAWSPALFPSSRIVKAALPANVIGIYFPERKRIAHVGFIEAADDSWCRTIEGNTSSNGSREGIGVFRKRRPMKSIYRIADWLSPNKKKS